MQLNGGLGNLLMDFSADARRLVCTWGSHANVHDVHHGALEASIVPAGDDLISATSSAERARFREVRTVDSRGWSRALQRASLEGCINDTGTLERSRAAWLGDHDVVLFGALDGSVRAFAIPLAQSVSIVSTAAPVAQTQREASEPQMDGSVRAALAGSGSAGGLVDRRLRCLWEGRHSAAANHIAVCAPPLVAAGAAASKLAAACVPSDDSGAMNGMNSMRPLAFSAADDGSIMAWAVLPTVDSGLSPDDGASASACTRVAAEPLWSVACTGEGVPVTALIAERAPAPVPEGTTPGAGTTPRALLFSATLRGALEARLQSTGALVWRAWHRHDAADAEILAGGTTAVEVEAVTSAVTRAGVGAGAGSALDCDGGMSSVAVRCIAAVSGAELLLSADAASGGGVGAESLHSIGQGLGLATVAGHGQRAVRAAAAVRRVVVLTGGDDGNVCGWDASRGRALWTVSVCAGDAEN